MFGQGRVCFLRRSGRKVFRLAIVCTTAVGLLRTISRGKIQWKESSVTIQNTLQKIRTNYLSTEKDWFEGNITSFEMWQKNTKFSFTVFRRSTVKTEGDFSCSSSEVAGSCAFKVDNIIQGVQLCNVYRQVCIGFVLTKGMKVYLKHKAKHLHYSNEAALFIRKSYSVEDLKA